MIHAMGGHLLKIDAITWSIKSHEEDFQQLQNTVLRDKQSSLHSLRLIVDRMKQTESMALE
eukprot:15346139-Ditylum_brightwellii.AAC.1